MTGSKPAVALFVLVGSVAAACGNWPQFRGPNAAATSAEKNLPIEWGAGKNIAWKVKVPGYGWSSPIVWGDKVFLTTAVNEKQKEPTGSARWEPGGLLRGPDAIYRSEVYCLSAADGKVLWKRTAAANKPAPITTSNTYASETPVTDGKRVYAYFGMTGIYCYDLAGKELWKKDLGPLNTEAGHGTGSSPALDGERLFIQRDNQEKSFLLALDAKTGKELWRVARAEVTGWSTPLIWKNKVRTEVVCLGSRHMRSYDPATGKSLWELGGTNGQCFGSPVASDDLLYAGTGGQHGGGRPLFAVKAGASGDITLKAGATANAGVAWYQPNAGPLMATRLLYRGHLYVLEQRVGVLSCYEAKTGKQVYRERLQRARGFLASPWAWADKVFCLDEDGTAFVVKAGPKFALLGQNKLNERCWASPAIAGRALFVRGVDHLYCIKNVR
jgi:outer membrane protein assembly factor BamB